MLKDILIGQISLNVSPKGVFEANIVTGNDGVEIPK